MLPLQPIRPTVTLERGDAKSETACTKRSVRLDYRKGPFRLASKLVVFRGENLEAQELCGVKGESSSEK